MIGKVSERESSVFSRITERSGDPVTRGQIADMCHRYRWASGFCHGRRVLEVGCGTGRGLGLLTATAENVIACDVVAVAVVAARPTYGTRVALHVAGAERLPSIAGGVDVVLILETISYLPDVGAFLRECHRVLRPGDRLPLSSTHKDLFDSRPSRSVARTTAPSISLACSRATDSRPRSSAT